MNLTQELTALALLSPRSISAPDGSVPTIRLPSGGTLQAQLGTGAVRDGAQARLVTLAELLAVPGGDPLPLVIWETAGPEAAADVLDSIPAAAVSGSFRIAFERTLVLHLTGKLHKCHGQQHLSIPAQLGCIGCKGLRLHP